MNRRKASPVRHPQIAASAAILAFACAVCSFAQQPTGRLNHAGAVEYHVTTNGNDSSAGSAEAPLRTIQRAADLAEPGDVITVHAGTYRERINPPRGGTSDTQRIVYQAARGEHVEIKGSEVIKDWVKVQGDVWKVTLPNTFFGNFNPYSDLIHGDWFAPLGRDHHTGAVYLNGDWLTEATKLDEVLAPDGQAPDWLSGAGQGYLLNLWFAQVDAKQTTIWAQFKGVNPNEQLVEINVRRTVFYPDKPGRNFITVRGFTMRHAATPWAPPTAEQIGLVGTHWSKGWIIESNTISHSVCSGIALGKHGDEFDNKSADSAEGYVKTIERAHAHAIPWTKENIGHHVVRNNTISHCEQAGIVGSLGCSFSTVSGNLIHDIHVRRLFTGAEMAGIKFHGAIDTEIRGNHVYHAYRGLWLDWMAQGTRVSGNLFHDNSAEDIYVEVNHGPFLIDNNLLLSSRSLWDMSEGGAFVHNLLTGKIDNWYDMGRLTPYMGLHSTAIAGLAVTQGGGNRYFNNIFVGQGLPGDAPVKTAAPTESISGHGLWVYDVRKNPPLTGGNVYLNGARPYSNEVAALTLEKIDPSVKLVEQPDGWYLEMNCDRAWSAATNCQAVTTTTLGKAPVPILPYEQPDGSALMIDHDYFGKKRDAEHPLPGPFAAPGNGNIRIRVWGKGVAE